MPRFLETKLKAEYGQNSAVPYKIMNTLGYMLGNKETSAGSAAQVKHERDMKAGTASGQHPHRNLGAFLHKKKAR